MRLNTSIFSRNAANGAAIPANVYTLSGKAVEVFDGTGPLAPHFIFRQSQVLQNCAGRYYALNKLQRPS
jgi:hypothetical protein